MLTTYFKAPRSLRRLRLGAAGPYLDGFAEFLHDAGYAREVARARLGAAWHLGFWTTQATGSLVNVDDAIIKSFRRHLATCCLRAGGGHTEDVAGAVLFREYLGKIGAVPPADAGPTSVPEPPVLQGFGAWMLRHRGLAATTFKCYRRIVGDLLHAVGEDPARLTAQSVRHFVLDRTSRRGRSHAKQVVTAVRMFLRYLVAQGACAASLVGAVPSVAAWRLSALPRYLPAGEVQRIVGTCDPSTPTGARDRAILLLLARLGLRAGDAANLRVGDIDWKEGSLVVCGKGRRQVRLPLPQDIGDALLAYLERRDAPVGVDHVFVSAQAPRRPFFGSNAVTMIVARAMRRAGVVAPSRGAHVLRHSAATEMLRQGSSLDAIASVLRHRSVESTAHYAKVDVALLREVAQPWPEVASC